MTICISLYSIVKLGIHSQFEMNEFAEKIFVSFPTHPSYLNDVETAIP